MVYSSYLDRNVTAATWGNMFKKAANLRVLRECGVDLDYEPAPGVSAASLAAEGAFYESLRYLLQEVGVTDPGGELRSKLHEADSGAAAAAS